jgi:hypothetical protein
MKLAAFGTPEPLATTTFTSLGGRGVADVVAVACDPPAAVVAVDAAVVVV